MDSINKTYHLEIEVLSPLHIGGGAEKDWVEEVDFVYDDNKVYKLNNKKVIQNIGVEKYSSILLNRNKGTLRNSISGNLKDLSDSDFKIPHKPTNDIKAFIKTGLDNKPYIPGSSIKGAIRSILLNFFKPEKTIRFNNILNEKYFGTPTKGDEFMRFIKISDAKFDKTELINTKIFNLTGQGNNIESGWKHDRNEGTTRQYKPNGFNVIYEIIGGNKKSIFTISLAQIQLENLFKHGDFQLSNQIVKKEIINEDITRKLFVIINNYTKSYIEKEKLFFQKFENNETQKIIGTFNQILENIPSDNSSCVVRMSAGSGFHSITGDWQNDNSHDIDKTTIQFEKSGKLITKGKGTFQGKDSAKSRKIAVSEDNFMPMGFVKLSLINQDEIERRESEKKQKIELEQKEKAEKQRKEALEKERIETEERLKQEAIEKAEAERIVEEKRIIEERDAALKRIAEQEKEAQERNKAKKEEDTNRLKEQGLSSLLKGINNFETGKEIIAKFKKTVGEIPENEKDSIYSFIQLCKNEASNKELTGFWQNYKKWGLIKSWAGNDLAFKWFNEINK